MILMNFFTDFEGMSKGSSMDFRGFLKGLYKHGFPQIILMIHNDFVKILFRLLEGLTNLWYGIHRCATFSIDL